MEMLQRAHTLQRDPILEPKYVVFTTGPQSVYKVLLHKGVDQRSALRYQVALVSICGDWSPGPDDNVRDAWLESIWPVV